MAVRASAGTGAAGCRRGAGRNTAGGATRIGDQCQCLLLPWVRRMWVRGRLVGRKHEGRGGDWDRSDCWQRQPATRRWQRCCEGGVEDGEGEAGRWELVPLGCEWSCPGGAAAEQAVQVAFRVICRPGAEAGPLALLWFWGRGRGCSGTCEDCKSACMRGCLSGDIVGMQQRL